MEMGDERTGDKARSQALPRNEGKRGKSVWQSVMGNG